MGDIPVLWPEDFGEAEHVVTPFSILKQQATALADRTGGELEGRVTRRADDEGDFLYSFRILAARLNYSYELFTAWHDPVANYPIHCRFRGDTTNCENQNQLVEWLKRVFSSNETKRVITSLLAQLHE